MAFCFWGLDGFKKDGFSSETVICGPILCDSSGKKVTNLSIPTNGLGLQWPELLHLSAILCSWSRVCLAFMCDSLSHMFLCEIKIFFQRKSNCSEQLIQAGDFHALEIPCPMQAYSYTTPYFCSGHSKRDGGRPVISSTTSQGFL